MCASEADHGETAEHDLLVVRLNVQAHLLKLQAQRRPPEYDQSVAAMPSLDLFLATVQIVETWLKQGSCLYELSCVAKH